MIWRARRRSLSAPPNPVVNEDDPPPRRDNLHATAHATGMAIKPRRFGDLRDLSR
jgi:hypothetical protein